MQQANGTPTDRAYPALLFHIDSRCIHGQIVAGWGIREHIARFVLANDAVAADEWERNQYLSTAGSEFETLVLSLADAVARLKEWQDGRKTMLIAGSPEDALHVVIAGIRPGVITIGNLEPGPGKQQLSPTVFVDAEDRAALGQIVQLGVKVLIQPLPNSAPIAVSSEQIADSSQQNQS